MSAAWLGGEIGARRRTQDNSRHLRLSVSEHRQHQRCALALRVTLKINGECFSADLLDISLSGALLRCSVVLREGARIEIAIDEIGALDAHVVRRLPKGIAAEFDLTEQQRVWFAQKMELLLKAPV